MQGPLQGLMPRDPAKFGATAALLAARTLPARDIPTRCAAQLEPMRVSEAMAAKEACGGAGEK